MLLYMKDGLEHDDIQTPCVYSGHHGDPDQHRATQVEQHAEWRISRKISCIIANSRSENKPALLIDANKKNTHKYGLEGFNGVYDMIALPSLVGSTYSPAHLGPTSSLWLLLFLPGDLRTLVSVSPLLSSCVR